MTAPYSGTPFPLSASFQLPGRIVNLSGLSAICGPGAPAPCSILMIVSGGSGSIEIDGNQHVLTAGSMLCCSSSLPLSLNAQFSLQGVWIEYTSVTRPGDADASPLNNGRLHSSAPQQSAAWPAGCCRNGMNRQRITRLLYSCCSLSCWPDSTSCILRLFIRRSTGLTVFCNT